MKVNYLAILRVCRSAPRRAIATPLGTLVTAGLVAAICGSVVHRQAYIVLAAIIAVIAIGVTWPWLSLQLVTATLSFEHDRGRENEPGRVNLTIRNRNILPAEGLFVVGLTRDDGEIFGPIVVLPLSSRVVAWDFVPPGRGEYPQGRIALRCRLPFGIWNARRSIALEQSLLVWPSLLTAKVSIDAPCVAPTGREQRLPRFGGGDECVGIRDYRRGDPLKLMHRLQTARHDRLIMRDLPPLQGPSVRIVLDSCAASYTSARQRETAIRIATGLCEQRIACGTSVETVIEGRLIRHSVGARRQIMDALARISSEGGPGLLELDNGTLSDGTGSSSIVITSHQAAQRHCADQVIRRLGRRQILVAVPDEMPGDPVEVPDGRRVEIAPVQAPSEFVCVG